MTTYAQLQADLASFSARSDISVVAPSLIRLSEAFINRKVRVLEQEQDVDLEFTSAGDYEADLPTGFLGFRSLINPDATNPDCEYMPPSAFNLQNYSTRDGFNSLRGSEGTLYTIASNKVKILVPVGSEDTVDLVGIAHIRFEALSISNTTNYLLTNHYDLYLFAGLREVWDYIGEDKEAARAELRAMKIIDEIEEEEKGKRRGAPPLRRRAPSRGVV